MKRLLLILLLMVVPFQMSWAAASAYCQHEEGAAARHLGHHSHQHKAVSEQAADAAKAEPKGGEKTAAKLPFGQADGDCSFCHGFGQATLGTTPGQTSAMAGLPDSAARAQFYRSHIPDGPKRPDWRSPA